MHRHGYKGRKLHREKDQRRALLKSLSESLFLNGSIETTLAKAKELVPYVERLITRAKKADLASRRIVLSDLQTKQALNRLFDEIAPKLANRNSGHLRIERTRLRRGDNAQMARVSFVDEIVEPEAPTETKTEKEPAKVNKTAKEASK